MRKLKVVVGCDVGVPCMGIKPCLRTVWGLHVVHMVAHAAHESLYNKVRYLVWACMSLMGEQASS